jgi:phosphatidate phosphatase LPIN
MRLIVVLRDRPGKNSISFSVYSDLQGIQTVSAWVYLWGQNVKIVISDIDGTITKSDFLGTHAQYI